MRKRLKQVLFIVILVLFLTIIIFENRSSNDFYLSKFNNSYPSQYKIIPNLIHYVIFGKESIDFPCFLSIISSLKIQKPETVYIHTDQLNFSGTNWKKILSINSTNPVIFLNYMSAPTHVFGQLLSSTYHGTDLVRIYVLQQWGGIYLDNDVILLKNLDKFRHFEMVVGWPHKEYIGTQILLANKNARFLNFWLEGYRRYIPTNWYYNAGQYPTEQVLEKMPHLAHRVPEYFGVQNLQKQLYKSNNWSDWKQYYAIHLLSRHHLAPKYINETIISTMNNTFKDIINYILFI